MIRPYTPTSETGEASLRLRPGGPPLSVGVQLPMQALQLHCVAAACHFKQAPAWRPHRPVQNLCVSAAPHRCLLCCTDAKGYFDLVVKVG